MPLTSVVCIRNYRLAYLLKSQTTPFTMLTEEIGKEKAS